MQNQPPFPDDRPDPASFQDDPFLEVLLEMICRDIYVLRGETFVDQARRWTEVLRVITELDPRNRHEWFLAAEVTRMRFAALHSLALYEAAREGTKIKRKHGLTMATRTLEMQETMRRYERVQKLRTG